MGKWVGNDIRSAQKIHHVAFAPDEERVLLSIGPVPSLQIWRYEHNELIAVLAQMRGGTQARFSPDGRLVIALDDTGAGRVWDAATGHAVTPPLRHGLPLAAAVVRGDGRQVVTVGTGGAVATWSMPTDTMVAGSRKDTVPDERPVAELLGLAQLLSCGRIDEKQQRQDFSPEALWAAWQAHSVK